MSPEPTSIGGGVLANLEAFGYSGRIHLVSRSRDEIRGRPCVKAIADLPKGIDDYGRIETEILEPMEQAYEAIREIGTGISHHFGAFG